MSIRDGAWFPPLGRTHIELQYKEIKGGSEDRISYHIRAADTERVLRNPYPSQVYLREADRAGRKFKTNFSFKIPSPREPIGFQI